MSFQNACFSKRPGIRLRPVPEMGQCLVYDPAGPRLYTLNITSWLVLLLCNGADADEMAGMYYKEVEPLLTAEAARAHVDDALRDLLAKDLVTCGHQNDTALSAPVGGE